MANIFEETTARIKNSKIVIWIFSMALLMLLVGFNHFVEDTLSSYYGIKMLEAAFGMTPVTYPFTYFTMSIAPQVAQVVFTYMFLTNTDRYRFAALGTLGALLVDFFADTWYRSNAQMFDSPAALIAAVVLTVAYFTIGSEVFVTFGFGIVMELFTPAFRQLRGFINDALDAAFSGKQRSASQSPYPPYRQQQAVKKDNNNPRF